MATFQERILLAYNRENERRKASGEQRLLKTEIWKAAGVTSAAASHWFNGPTGADLSKCVKIAPLLRCDPLWLFDESREFFNTNSPEELLSSYSKQRTSHAQSSNVTNAPDIRGLIPLISFVQAGMWNEAIDIYDPGYAERWLPFIKSNGENVFALRVSGDSMTSRYGKTYPSGCIIFVDPDQKTPTNGDRIVAKLTGSNDVTFKVFTQDAGRSWLTPLNDMHKPIYDEFTVIGKVIGKWEDE